MLVRHNTQLLEQAVDLLVKRAAIPTLEAEAAAQDKIARATGFRRMATGAAVAFAAIGLGIGAALFFDRGDTKIAEEAPKQPKQTDRVHPDDRIADVEKKPRIDDGKEIPVPPSKPIAIPPEKPVTIPDKPDVKTVEFTKFVNRDVQLMGGTWRLTSGHFFRDENDVMWENAWCYTRQVVNGVDVNIELVNRVSPSAKPQAPISSGATLASVGLNDDTALNLATECPWLDGVSFRRSDFAEGIARRTEREKAQEFVVKDGWDALGGDFMNMPMRNVSFEDCQTQCNRNDRCMALTYNKKFRACFLKGSATVLVRNIDAATAARRVVEAALQYSSLVFATNTVVVGHSYSNTEMGYADCISACSTAEVCVGFNFDSKNRMCALMDNVVSSSKFTGVESGLKATAN
ncbi:PAN/Apple domain-containing protein [Borborobacter arsenicus]|nr:PAN/Apple domain-containing protein [Pseudaminobacter arsenicus]